MSNNIIIFLIFISILVFIIQGTIGVYIVGEKGKNIWLGFWIGGFMSLIGIVILAMMKPTDNIIVDEMYKRKLINLKEYQETKEFKLKK